MKKYVFAAALMLSLNAFAQKDELKALRKLSDKDATAGNVQESKKLLTEVEGKMGSADNEQKVEYHYYKGKTALNDMLLNPNNAKTAYPVAWENLQKAIELEKNEKRQKYTEEIKQQLYPKLKNGVLQLASTLSQEKKYKEAADYYKAAYNMDNADQVNLFNAAAMAVNGEDYENALKYYLELDKLGFTGEGTLYFAKNKATGQVEQFPGEQLRDVAVSGGSYVEPTQQVLPSLKGEIVKNIALIYNMQGETEKAKQAITKAKKANPDDVGLVITEAELYLKTNDTIMYKNLVKEAITKNPKNADLFYNLAVVSSKTDKDEAIRLYNKVIEIDPEYVNALINLSVLTLKDEQKIVEQMNSLGTTAADNKKYDALKQKRNDLYKKAVPYLERAQKVEPDNQYVLSLLATMYQALERMDDYKAVKAKLKS